MKMQLFSGWKTRMQALGLALLVGVAGLTGTLGVMAQDATAPVAEAVGGPRRPPSTRVTWPGC
jgi:hypothetical protein